MNSFTGVNYLKTSKMVLSCGKELDFWEPDLSYIKTLPLISVEAESPQYQWKLKGYLALQDCSSLSQFFYGNIFKIGSIISYVLKTWWLCVPGPYFVKRMLIRALLFNDLTTAYDSIIRKYLRLPLVRIRGQQIVFQTSATLNDIIILKGQYSFELKDYRN